MPAENTPQSSGFNQIPTNNKWCPVEPDKKAKAKHAFEYKETTIHFCCANCIDDFQASPELYIGKLPESLQKQLGEYQKLPSISGFSDAKSEQKKLLIERPYKISETTLDLFLSTGGASLFLIGTLIIITLRKKSMTMGHLAGFTLIILLLGTITNLIFYSIDLSSNLQESKQQIDHQRLMDTLHYATFYEFGNPLHVPNDKPERSLTTTYYRGNDERSPELFNNGFYRTCTFLITLTDQDGNILAHNDKINQKLFLKVDIQRAPHTPDKFFSEKLISKMLLTTNSSPIIENNKLPNDAVRFTSSKKNYFFSALFPLPQKPELNQKHTVYIREERFAAGVKLGSRVHYAIELSLKTNEDGSINDSSNLWMGSTYRTRRLRNWEIPPNEWLSLAPIPELPGPHKNVDDKTLGITEQDKEPMPKP